MGGVKSTSPSLLVVACLCLVAACSSQVNGGQARTTGVTVFEGARLITGDGSAPIENTVTDRKSTRLNSSHITISYAVFCLKKKNKHAAEVADDVPHHDQLLRRLDF